MSGLSPGPSPLPATIARVLITGFMGAGKTTVGRLLADRLGWTFADSDHLLEAQTGRTIADLFATRGEPAFRELEAAVVREHVGGERLVLALGGGALERPQTRERLAALPEAVLIFLDAPLDMLIARCSAQPDAPVRPVLADRGRLQERWAARLPWYRQAHLTVNTAGSSPGEVAERILGVIESRCHAASSPKTGVPA